MCASNYIGMISNSPFPPPPPQLNLGLFCQMAAQGFPYRPKHRRGGGRGRVRVGAVVPYEIV